LFCVWQVLFPVRVEAQSSPATSAQAPANDPDDEATPAAPLFGVSVTLEASGKAEVDSSFYLTDDPNLPSNQVKEVLQSALGCKLQDSPLMRSMRGSQFYAGSCMVPTSSTGLLRQGQISTVPLQTFATLHGVDRLSVTLHLPDSEVLETIPAVASQNSSASLQPEAAASIAHFMRSFFVFAASPQHPLPPQIVFRYGYAPSTIRRTAAIFVTVLLAPLALFFWLGRKALSADVTDKAVVWFSYMRSLAWVLNGSLLGWWVALEYCHAESLLRFLSAGTRFAVLGSHPAAFEALGWVPPAILWLLCYRISHPIQQKLRGLIWTKRDLTLQALYSVLAGLFPLALFLTGLRVITSGGFRSAMYWWLAAFLLRVVAAQGLLKITGMQPQALSSGDLRDRAFALAERLRVNLQQVYLIPSGKGQVANAFARTGNTIAFTDLLLQRMSQREVDFVLAHELTHLKLKHPAKLGYAHLAAWFVGFFALSMLAPLFHADPAARYALIFVIVSVFPFFWSRRFEYAADAGAVAATGDPGAAISALFKLSELNMTPIHWSKWREKWLTHPSSLRRARAIAKLASIPTEEIPALARAGEAGTYVIPAEAAPGAKLHSTQRIKSASLKLSFLLVGLLALVPAVVSLAAIHSVAPLKWIVFAAAAPLTFAFFLLLSNYSTRLTRGALVPSLNTKLAGQGIQAASWSGIFVNFSPAAAPRLYDGSATWDIGYVFLRSDRLCYCGEETSFALRQDQITEIRVADGLPALVASKRIYIAWKDEERGGCGVFNISCGNAASTLQGNRLTADLASRLDAWWKASPVTRPLPPQLAQLASPQIRAVTSQKPGANWKPRRLAGELLWTAIFTGVGATLCGLPFHLTPFLLNLVNPAFYSNIGIQNHFSSPGAGWFAVLVAVLIRFVIITPALRYRDVPKLVAASVAKTEVAPPPPPPAIAPANSNPTDKERIPVH
jgi:Zn-dependent protease with chaperone function